MRVGLFLLSLMMLVAVACGGDDPPSPAATVPTLSTRIPFPTSAPVPTATATVLPTPRPGADTAPQGTQTGDVAIDRIISAILSRDAGGLAQLYGPFPVPCSNEPGIGAPPPCRGASGAIPPGTPLFVIAIGNCEGSWSLDAMQPAAALTSQPTRLFAVAKVVPPSPIYRDGDFPLVDHFIVLEYDSGSSRQAMRLGITNGRIVSQFAGCGQPPENVDLRNYVDDYEIVLRGPAYR